MFIEFLLYLLFLILVTDKTVNLLDKADANSLKTSIKNPLTAMFPPHK